MLHVFLPFDSGKALRRRKWTKELGGGLSDLLPLHVCKRSIFSSMGFKSLQPPFVLDLASNLSPPPPPPARLPPWQRLAGQAATTRPVNSQSGPHPWAGFPPRWALRFATRPTPPTLREERQQVYRSPHGRCLRETTPPAPPLCFCTNCPSSPPPPPHAVLHCRGVAAAPRGHICFLQSPLLWKLCVISGAVNGERAGMHTAHCYHHTGAEEAPGAQSHICCSFASLCPENRTCITWRKQNKGWAEWGGGYRVIRGGWREGGGVQQHLEDESECLRNRLE